MGALADPTLPWGMVFRGAGDLPRHPSQVYQFLMEGLLLFALLWWYARTPRKQGQVAAVFLLGYGVFRFVAEFSGAGCASGPALDGHEHGAVVVCAHDSDGNGFVVVVRSVRNNARQIVRLRLPGKRGKLQK